jgi:hypothetical protein
MYPSAGYVKMAIPAIRLISPMIKNHHQFLIPFLIVFTNVDIVLKF